MFFVPDKMIIWTLIFWPKSLWVIYFYFKMTLKWSHWLSIELSTIQFLGSKWKYKEYIFKFKCFFFFLSIKIKHFKISYKILLKLFDFKFFEKMCVFNYRKTVVFNTYRNITYSISGKWNMWLFFKRDIQVYLYSVSSTFECPWIEISTEIMLFLVGIVYLFIFL